MSSSSGMRVFIAGGTGAIGRHVVPRLLQAGHHVTVLTRSAERAETLRAKGVEAAIGSVLDASRLYETMRAVQPDVVIHLLTGLPASVMSMASLSDTDVLRTEGTSRLLNASVAVASVRRFMVRSVSFLSRPQRTARVLDETHPLYLRCPSAFRPLVKSVDALEKQVLSAGDELESIVLRYGFLYGRGTQYEVPGGSACEEALQQKLRIVGKGKAMWSFVHVEDAADATVLAVGRGAPGIYNIADDCPAPAAEWIPHFCAAVGAPSPTRIPLLLARFVAGSYAKFVFRDMCGASNAKAKRELGWVPAHPDWHESLGSVDAESSANDTTTRI